jgi:PHD/YefM family antitoxin component YafN of YafNO toxin-antitoxin module
MPELTFKLVLVTNDANLKLSEVTQEANTAKEQIEKPAAVKITAEQALATIRDVKIAFDGVLQVIGSVVSSMNSYLDASLEQRQAAILAKVAFGESATEMSNFASAMQKVTNFGDEEMLVLMAKLAQTYKLNKIEIQDLTPVLLDFAEANKSTGMTIESAFDLMGRALNGHTEMLGRYGIELDDTRLKTEGVSYLVEKLSADYNGTATALADLRLQNANAWGDVKETIGDMLTTLITPLLKGLKNLFEWYQNLAPVMKGFVTGLAIAIPTIIAVATAITTLTVAINALKVAINPVAGIISIAVGALATLGFAYASTKVANDAAISSQTDYKDTVDSTTESVESLVAKHREIASSIDYEEAKRRLHEIKKEIDDYNDTLAIMNSGGSVLIGSDYFDKQKDRLAEQQALREKVYAEDLKAQTEFNKEKTRLEAESNLTGIALLEYRLSEEKKHFKELGKISADNVDEQTSSLNKIRSLETQIAQAKQRDMENLASLEQKYNLNSISDLTKRKTKELEIQRDAELEKARSLGASEELLASITSYYAGEITRIEQEAINQRIKQAETEQKEKQRLAEEEDRRLQELSDTKYEFSQTQLDLDDNQYQAQLDAIDNYYARKKDKLLAAGLTEEQITRQIEQSKARVRDQFDQKHIEGISQTLGNLAKTTELFGKKGFALWKTLAIAQAMVDTYASATAAYKAMVGIPIVGPGLAIAAAAAAIGAGLANVAAISKTEPPKAAKGGMLVGNSHDEGGVLIEAEGEEYITAKDRVKALGRNLFDFLNFAPLSQVRSAFAGLPIPDIPIPSNVSSIYATGGSVGSGGGISALIEIMTALKTEITEMKQNLKDSKPIIDIHVDPLSNDPVRVSEIADTGKLIRSEV